MGNNKRNDTTIGDVFRSHFGIDQFREARAERNSSIQKERIESMQVKYGNAPVVQAEDQPSVQIQYDPGAATYIPHVASFDNKCPSCGGTIAFDPAAGALVCAFCGKATPLQGEVAAPWEGYSLIDLQNNAGKRLQSSAKRVVCGTCGGVFISVTSSLSGLCPYCGSNSISASGDAVGVLEPTGIIPFRIGKEEAQTMFMQWIRGRRLSPMDLVKNSEITDLVGVYVPYWVFDCDTRTPYSGKFGKTYNDGDSSYTKYHNSTSVCELPIRNLTLVASSRLEKDPYWKVVSQFDMTAMMRYDPNLLAGFWSESYTVEGPAAWNTAMGKIYDRIRKQIKTMEDADLIAKINMQPAAGNIRAKYVLAPMWITSFDYRGVVYRVLINGQTGNIVGTWPKSLKRFFMIFGLIAGGIFTTQFLMLLLQMLIEWLKTRGG